MRERTVAMLRTDTKINPIVPENNPFYEPQLGQVLYVLEKLDTLKLAGLTSFGDIFSDGPVGQVFEGYADQSGRRLGDYRVIGWVDFESGGYDGVVPNANLQHYVVK